MPVIILTKNYKATVDQDAYDWLSDYNWMAMINTSGVAYAVRAVRIYGKIKNVFLHRIIAGYPECYSVHFRDRNPLNCAKTNLLVQDITGRECKWMPRGNGTSQFTGVIWDATKGLWRAEIGGMLIAHYVGETDAARAYNIKARELRGPQAPINTIPFMDEKESLTPPESTSRLAMRITTKRGVKQRTGDGKWAIRDTRDGKRPEIGPYDSQDEAAAALDELRVQRGEVERING